MFKRPLFVTLLFAGCAGTEYTIVSKQDADDGSTIEQLAGNVLSGSEPWHQIELNFERITHQGRPAEYFFVLKYENRSVMYKERSLSIGADESLVLIVDGARFRFKAIGEGSVKGVREGFETESARYSVSIELVQLMSRAAILEVLVHGTTNATQKYFNHFNFEYLNQFLMKFGKS